MKTLEQEFHNPSAAYRGKPFWAWNGKLEEQELLRQIDVLHEMGFGGFFMHSRTGLQTEYLGEDWFRLTDACIKRAQELGMEPWIYDEDRWPSGCAGGLVTKEPPFRRKYLTLTLNEAADSSEPPLAVFAARIDGLSLSPGYRSFDRLQPGETKLVFRVHTMQPQSVYNGFTDSDRLSLAATERFLDVTHRQYAARCTEFSSIRGVFTDEPHRGMVFSDFSDPGEERRWSLPWTDNLPEAFEAAYGEPLLPRLPELFLLLRGKPVSRLKWQYMELLQTLFMTRFLQPVRRWAQENGLKTTGHFLHEDSLSAQAVPTGSLMRCYEYLDEPGIDNLTAFNFTPWAVKQLESAARQFGKTKKLSELFGATGWQMTFRDYKYIANWQTLLGINVRCPHLAWYTMQGQAKRDYPESFLHQATWYREHAALEAKLSRLGLLISQGTPVCRTLVLHPVESLWYQIHPGWVNGLDAAEPAMKRLERQFRQLFHWLMQTQTDFDYGDEGILAAHAAVDAAQPAALRVGQMRYRRVVICGCTCIRASTLQLLRSFSAAGGELVWIGTPPRYIAGEAFSECASLAAAGIRLPLRKSDVLRYFRAQPQSVRIMDDNAAAEIYLQMRQTDDCIFAFLWNKSMSRTLHDVPVRIPDGLYAELWDCRDGAVYALPVRNNCVSVSLAPGAVRTVRLCREQRALPPLPLPPQTEPVFLRSPAGFRLNEPNVLPLDRAALWLDEELLCAQDEILKLDRTLRGRLGMEQRSGEMLQPWARKGPDTSYPIRLCFSVLCEQLPQTPLLLALEDLPAQTLTVNGMAISLCKAAGFWVDSCFSLYALPAACWKLGENQIEWTAAYSEVCGLEAAYLLGDVGVWFRSGTPVIGCLPQTLKIGNLVYQGLPFYSGKVRYLFDVPADQKFWLQLDAFGGSCTAAACGGERTVFWGSDPIPLHSDAARTLELELILNRRNTFGPLHRFPRKQPYIAPDSFTCDDASRYCLYPTGLLCAPKVYFEESICFGGIQR